MYLVLLTAVRVVRKGFCPGPKVSGPEKDTLCSEALDEDTLIPECGWAILLVKQKEKSMNGEQK